MKNAHYSTSSHGASSLSRKLSFQVIPSLSNVICGSYRIVWRKLFDISETVVCGPPKKIMGRVTCWWKRGGGRGGYYFDREKKHSEDTETSCQPVSKKTDQTRKKLKRKWYCFGLSCSNFIEDGQWIFQKWRLVKATDPFSIVIVKLVRRFLFNWLMLLETGVTFHQIGGVVLLLEVAKEKIMLRIGAVIESWNFLIN